MTNSLLDCSKPLCGSICHQLLTRKANCLNSAEGELKKLTCLLYHYVTQSTGFPQEQCWSNAKMIPVQNGMHEHYTMKMLFW